MPSFCHHAKPNVLRDQDASLPPGKFKKFIILEAIRAFFSRMHNIHAAPPQLLAERGHQGKEGQACRRFKARSRSMTGDGGVFRANRSLSRHSSSISASISAV